MNDIVAIFHKGERFTVGFCIDGKWWPVCTSDCKTRTWPSPESARDFLRGAEQRYWNRYGGFLGWNVDAVPVLTVV